MIIKGISFEVAQDAPNNLSKILSPVAVEEYNWFVERGQTEVWRMPSEEDFFDKDFYYGCDFQTHIQENCFIVFLRLQAYDPLGTFQEIHTYRQFLESDCRLLLLIYDCEQVEIYAKEETVLSSIYEVAAKEFGNVQLLSDINCIRSRLDIL